MPLDVGHERKAVLFMPRRTGVENAPAAVADVLQLLIDDLRAVALGFARAILHVDNIVRKDAVKVLAGDAAVYAHRNDLRCAFAVAGQIGR